MAIQETVRQIGQKNNEGRLRVAFLLDISRHRLASMPCEDALLSPAFQQPEPGVMMVSREM
jgi:hypothetical protein